ncbi:MAG: hypothetical protein QNK19_10445 [Xanthomonadales bacterium]|nr:hypothetical protein [Xanthomonadales bacterium]
MKFFRTLALIVSASLLFTACSKGPDDTAVTVKENTNPLLAYVPADTAYVFADLETVPVEITDAYVERFQPVLDVMSDQINKFQAGYQAGEFQDNQVAQLGMAVLDELGGSLSKENLEKLGISLQSHHAVYGTGVFPVIRLSLGDEQKLREAIARIEVKMGYQLPVKTLNGTSYWRVSENEMPVAVYIAILDQQLAFSVFPVNSEDRLLAAFLGQEMPADSMASSNALGTMNTKKGYSTYGSGFVDIQKLTDEIMNPDSETRSLMGAEANSHLDSLDAVCVAEIKSMIARTPRMTVGTTRLTNSEVAMRYDLEIESLLASGLAALVSNAPPAGKADYLLSASLAIRVGKLRSFVLEKATAIFESPYQCASLQNLNAQAGQLMTQLNTPMPPMVNNLMGIRARLDDFDPDREIIQNSGLLALHVDKPEMFVGMASMMVPGFENLDLANQTEPVRIPADVLHMEGIDVFALMSDGAIGASIGEQHVKDLGGFLNEKPQDNGTFLSISHDMGKQMEIQAALADQFQVDAGDEYGAVNEYAEAVKKAYTDILGQSHVEMRLTADGLHIDTSLNFK